MSVISRFVSFHARAGEGEKLAEGLLRAASLVADAPGCQSWLVYRDQADLDGVRVSEIWATHYRLQSGTAQGWAHRHSVAEEIYVAASRSGRITVDELPFELWPLDAVRVAPASARELEAGPDGLEVLAFGLHSFGDGGMVARS